MNQPYGFEVGNQARNENRRNHRNDGAKERNKNKRGLKNVRVNTLQIGQVIVRDAQHHGECQQRKAHNQQEHKIDAGNQQALKNRGEPTRTRVHMR